MELPILQGGKKSRSTPAFNFNVKYLEKKLKAQTFSGFQYCNRHSDISIRKYIIISYGCEIIYETFKDFISDECIKTS